MPGRALLGPIALALAGCTAADNLSFDEIVVELDGIVAVAGDGANRRISYQDRAPTSAWYMRQFWLVPLRWPLGLAFGVRHDSELENAAGHVRELIDELTDETGGDLEPNCEALLRLGWIASFDNSSASRIVALDGMAEIALRLDLPVLRDDGEALAGPLPEAQLAAAREVIRGSRPVAREGARLDAAAATAYADALGTIASRPLGDAASRLLLVQDLVALLRGEPQRDLRPRAAAALRAAMVHVVRETVVEIVRDRVAAGSELRLCAMEQFRRLGGPARVPLLLALMTAPSAQVARGEPRFEPDDRVRLRLILYCGQLRGDLALQEVRLPGAQAWEGIAPADFLAQTILTEQSYYSKLRQPALAALSLSLERPRLDYDPAWVKAWAEQRTRQPRSPAAPR